MILLSVGLSEIHKAKALRNAWFCYDPNRAGGYWLLMLASWFHSHIMSLECTFYLRPHRRGSHTPNVVSSMKIVSNQWYICRYEDLFYSNFNMWELTIFWQGNHIQTVVAATGHYRYLLFCPQCMKLNLVKCSYALNLEARFMEPSLFKSLLICVVCVI